MNIENQVCTLQQAKRLAELGIKQESYFKHVSRMIPYQIGFYWQLSPTHTTLKHDTEWYSAFTVAELGALLPDFVMVNDDVYTLKQNLHQGGKWSIKYRKHGPRKNEPLKYVSGTNEAELRAELLVYLLENSYLKIDTSPSK